jgi:adenine phosphoribosyltransferase
VNISELRAFIRDVPDFPEKGVIFRDITPLLQEPEAFATALEAMSAYIAGRSPQRIVAIESRGFLFGAPIAARLGVPLVPVRRPGKLPSAHMSVEYRLEYGEGQLDIHTDALKQGERVVIVDDLIATGGTSEAASKLVELLGAQVAGIAFLIELTALQGRRRLTEYDVFTVLQID